MTQKTSLLQLSEDILTIIATLAGVLSLHELIKVGNRLLTHRLSGIHAISRYCNRDEYGNPIVWSDYVIKQLRGLKSLILSTDPLHVVTAVSPPVLLQTLPETIEEIRIDSLNVLEHWYTPKSDNPTLLTPFDFASRYPQLQNLSLTYSELNCEPNSCVKRDCWLSDHLPLLPPSLTGLHLNWPFPDLLNHLSDFPTRLQALTFSVTRLSGIFWLSSLPYLTFLKIEQLFKWMLLEHEIDVEKAVTVHSTLKTVELPDLLYIVASATVATSTSAVRSLFAYFSNVEHLTLPNVAFDHSELLNLTNLQSLKCREFPRLGSAAATSASAPLYPLSLTELHVSDDLGPTIAESVIARFPNDLRVLDASLMILTCECASLLPRSLTHISVKTLEGPLDVLAVALPPTLRYLRVAWMPFNPLMPTSIDYLAQLPPQLQVFGLDQPYYRSQNRSCSLLTSYGVETGWTTFAHAANKADLDSMHELLKHYPAFSTSMPQIDYNGEIPISSLEWLRMRGVLNSPPQIGSVSPKFIAETLRRQNLNLLGWGLPFCSKRAWRALLPNVAVHLAQDGMVPILEWLDVNEYSMDYESDPEDVFRNNSNLLTLSLANGQLHAAQWFLEHGHRRIDLFVLLPMIMGSDAESPNLLNLPPALQDVTVLIEFLSDISRHSMDYGGIQWVVRDKTADSSNLYDLLMQCPSCCSQGTLTQMLDFLVQHLGMDPSQSEFSDNPSCPVRLYLSILAAKQSDSIADLRVPEPDEAAHGGDPKAPGQNDGKSTFVPKLDLQSNLPLAKLLLDYGFDFGENGMGWAPQMPQTLTNEDIRSLSTHMLKEDPPE